METKKIKTDIEGLDFVLEGGYTRREYHYLNGCSGNWKDNSCTEYNLQ